MSAREIRVIFNLVTEEGTMVREIAQWSMTDVPAKGDRFTYEDTTYMVLDRRWCLLDCPACVVSVSFGIKNEHLVL